MATGALLTLLTLTTPAEVAAADATAVHLAGSGECTYPAKPIKGTPWSLQRVLLDQLWQDTKGKDAQGRPVRVAVIDTGVDVRNPQLAGAVDVKSGSDLLTGPKDTLRGPTVDPVGHGTKVAGIIAARPTPSSGFVGLAPESVIIPIRQNDEKGTGSTQTLAVAVKQAVEAGARVINISQDTADRLKPDSDLERAVQYALAQDVVVVASAGNDGADGTSKPTYPAAYPGVLAVGASDRNNERAYFSQPGDFIGVAAPGVDMVSTVPGGGQCADHGTSFSAPYVAGVAALIRAKHPDWKQNQVVAQIEQTAERAVNGRDRYVGWGVVDPVRALSEDERPLDQVTLPKGPVHGAAAPRPAPLPVGESAQDRQVRLATYVLGGTAVLVAAVTGASMVARERNRRRGAART
ncbi:type VII secretion-associated serine protease [Streptomyces mashuensis]|uniref:Type VII secretion-associated serine protease n=1 Tax=Streptomyces mashuensis TaxID=33904 RepID=A0A919B998_9ACTN|nr:type VII secretion-associated serine protease mycosin [Streptomyces mashuensis]GHF74773.1 type VII secretion-associated serine protease [Streptomyces mashuensis]